jgi:hypothetical protein
MPKSYWIVTASPANFQIAKDKKFDVLGLRAQHKRKVQRIENGDQLLLYITHLRVFSLTATVDKPFFEDNSPIYGKEGDSTLPYRIGIKPDLILEPSQYLDACHIAPRMDYIKRWVPEMWFMAFEGSLHLISKSDFFMISEEIRKAAKTPIGHPMKPLSGSIKSNCALHHNLG